VSFGLSSELARKVPAAAAAPIRKCLRFIRWTSTVKGVAPTTIGYAVVLSYKMELT
jgi:hypothetical protein